MTPADKTMYALLSMDAYNQHYSPGLTGAGLSVGSATFLMDSRDLHVRFGGESAQSAGFDAAAYNYGGEIVIAMRGTGSKLATVTDEGDILNGYSVAFGGSSGPQAMMAIPVWTGQANIPAIWT